MTPEAVLIISDLHSEYQVLNQQILHAEQKCGCIVSQVFVLGDFGIFADELKNFFRRDENRFLRPVSFIEGNHEDHGEFSKLINNYDDVFQYIARGTLHRLGHWSALCLGGARYMDAATTPRGSEITEEDLDLCLSYPAKDVDLILTHDCPTTIGVEGAVGMEHYGIPGEPRLDVLETVLQPRWWFFGHHHRWFDFQKNETRFVGLPESWRGFVLLYDSAHVELVRNLVAIGKRPWWKRVLGMQ
ncbi:MAG: hypothetical protein GY780_04715 [bacterium]|nr:hypothetical protein [bacterium]